MVFHLALAMVAAAATKTSSRQPAPSPSSIIDILSSQPQYSKFLRLIQRKGLVPEINLMENITLFAPVNAAFVDEGEVEELYKYILYQRMRVGWMPKEPVIFETAYQNPDGSNYTIEIVPDFELMEYVVDYVAPIVEEDIYAKHQKLFIQGIMRLLPEKPKACRVLLNDASDSINGSAVSFIKQLFQSMEQREPNYCAKFFKHRRSVFLPSDTAIYGGLSQTERIYYTGLYRAQQVKEIELTEDAQATMAKDIAKFLDSISLLRYIIGPNGTDSKFNGHKVKHNATHVEINGAALVVSVVLADAVVHVFDTPTSIKALDANVASMTLEKVLFSLHYSKFVEELKFRKLGHLLKEKKSNYRLFVDVTDRDDFGDDEMMIRKFSSKQQLLYQFSEKKANHGLVDSLMCSNKRVSGCFKHKLTTDEDGDIITLNDAINVIEGPFDAGKSEIYVVDSEVVLPSSLKRVMGEIMSAGRTRDIILDKKNCLKTLELLLAHKLFDFDDDGGYSAFLPCAQVDASISAQCKPHTNWNTMGLVYDFLEDHPHWMNSVLQGLFVKSPIYSDFSPKSPTKFKLLNGEHVFVDRPRQLTSYLTLNNTSVFVPPDSDVLFNQGVIHLVPDVILPDHLNIPLKQLINTTITDTHAPNVLELIKLVPGLEKALGLRGEKPKFSLLVPSQESLKDFNITSSFDKLTNLFNFHLVPENELNNLLDCVTGCPYNSSKVIATNLTDEKAGLICRHQGSKTYLQYVNTDKIEAAGYNKDHQVEVVLYGCEHPNLPYLGPCVFVLDKPLNLKWINPDLPFLHIHLGWVLVGIGIICGLLLVALLALLVTIFGMCSKKKGERLPLLGDVEDPFADRRPSFIKILLDNADDLTGLHERGYETDIDIFREEEQNPRRWASARRKYGAIGSIERLPTDTAARTAPRQIKGRDITKNWQTYTGE